MKLYELTGIKKLNSLSVSDLIMYFIDNSNYLFAGNGAQAYVFIHPNNKEVIKFWMFDSAYEAFIKYVKEHQSNQFLPKIIKGINELKFKNHTIKYIRMEKLKELKVQIEKALLENLDSLMEEYKKVKFETIPPAL